MDSLNVKLVLFCVLSFILMLNYFWFSLFCIIGYYGFCFYGKYGWLKTDNLSIYKDVFYIMLESIKKFISKI